MFNRIKTFQNPEKAASDAAIVEMLNSTQAIISFEPNGTILDANDAFLGAMGYQLEEIVGQHHRMFCDPAYVSSSDYSDFWRRLAAGEAFTDEFERFHKNGNSIWISATYAAVRDLDGSVVKVMKVAHDITERKVAMQQFQDAIENLAEGHSGARVHLQPDNSFYPLANNFNRAMDTLQRQILELKGSAETITSDAVDRKTRNEATLDRTASQERRIGEMSDLATSVSETMGRTMQTVKTAMEKMSATMAALAKGQTLIDAAQETTRSLETKAKSMSEINRMIDDLSFQTNLLALNAGVEAARAGEAGAGFSVVASEIRSLAQQSSSASAQINDLIRETTQTSTNAAEDVGAGSEAFGQIKSELSALQEAFEPVVGDLAEQVKKSDRVDQSASESLRSVTADRDAASRNLTAIEDQITILNEFCDRLADISERFAA